VSVQRLLWVKGGVWGWLRYVGCNKVIWADYGWWGSSLQQNLDLALSYELAMRARHMGNRHNLTIIDPSEIVLHRIIGTSRQPTHASLGGGTRGRVSILKGPAGELLS
jgi:hypothetical protein